MLKKEDIDNNLFNEKRMDEFIELYNDSLVIKSDNNPINTWIKKLENNELKLDDSNAGPYSYSMVIHQKILNLKIILEKKVILLNLH